MSTAKAAHAEQVLALYRGGTPRAVIRQRLGLTINQVAGVIERAKVPPKPPVEGYWTDERRATLVKLWAEGRSASQIANHLGAVTRNAVIGIVHRMGLGGRATPSRPRKAPSLRAATSCAAPRPPKPAETGLRAPPVARATACNNNLNLGNGPRDPVGYPDGGVQLLATCSLLQLERDMCRFPIGDPRAPDFGFCGRPQASGSYCGHHASVVMNPAMDGKRRNGTELARNLRRFL